MGAACRRVVPARALLCRNGRAGGERDFAKPPGAATASAERGRPSLGGPCGASTSSRASDRSRRGAAARVRRCRRQGPSAKGRRPSRRSPRDVCGRPRSPPGAAERSRGGAEPLSLRARPRGPRDRRPAARQRRSPADQPEPAGRRRQRRGALAEPGPGRQSVAGRGRPHPGSDRGRRRDLRGPARGLRERPELRGPRLLLRRPQGPGAGLARGQRQRRRHRFGPGADAPREGHPGALRARHGSRLRQDAHGDDGHGERATGRPRARPGGHPARADHGRERCVGGEAGARVGGGLSPLHQLPRRHPRHAGQVVGPARRGLQALQDARGRQRAHGARPRSPGARGRVPDGAAHADASPVRQGPHHAAPGGSGQPADIRRAPEPAGSRHASPGSAAEHAALHRGERRRAQLRPSDPASSHAAPARHHGHRRHGPRCDAHHPRRPGPAPHAVVRALLRGRSGGRRRVRWPRANAALPRRGEGRREVGRRRGDRRRSADRPRRALHPAPRARLSGRTRGGRRLDRGRQPHRHRARRPDHHRGRNGNGHRGPDPRPPGLALPRSLEHLGRGDRGPVPRGARAPDRLPLSRDVGLPGSAARSPEGGHGSPAAAAWTAAHSASGSSSAAPSRIAAASMGTGASIACAA
jgi:hypothetical protein